eukprot:scaffold329001_cov55-Tisochrysis_lutea.AAC.1
MEGTLPREWRVSLDTQPEQRAEQEQGIANEGMQEPRHQPSNEPEPNHQLGGKRALKRAAKAAYQPRYLPSLNRIGMTSMSMPVESCKQPHASEGMRGWHANGGIQGHWLSKAKAAGAQPARLTKIEVHA